MAMPLREFTLANLQGTGAQSDEDVAAADANAAWRVHWACISVSADALVQLTNGADAATTRIVDAYIYADAEPFVYAPTEGFMLTKGSALKLTTSTGNVKVTAHLSKMPQV